MWDSLKDFFLLENNVQIYVKQSIGRPIVITGTINMPDKTT